MSRTHRSRSPRRRTSERWVDHMAEYEPFPGYCYILEKESDTGNGDLRIIPTFDSDKNKLVLEIENKTETQIHYKLKLHPPPQTVLNTLVFKKTRGSVGAGRTGEILIGVHQPVEFPNDKLTMVVETNRNGSSFVHASFVLHSKIKMN